MIDFIEYVVTELKSKRLSKANAVSLIRQFSRGSAKSAGVQILHPLLHRNASDLTEQRFSSTFTGQEFFLSDHQVTLNKHAVQKVLPGVAYLEMVRAAIEQAWPERPEKAILELHNTVWAQPLVVSAHKDVGIALLLSDDESVEYEVFAEGDEGEDVVHCQGLAVISRDAMPSAIDVEDLKAEMTRGELAPDDVYERFGRMGLSYGPTFRAVSAIHLGSGQLLAELRLPEGVADDAYVLHPSLMDGATQAAIGLLDGEVAGLRLPFALETLRVVSPCTENMIAWLRFAPGSQAGDKVVKLDIDLIDERGNVCVQMRGFSWRLLTGELTADAKRRTSGTLFAEPQWQVSAGGGPPNEYAEHHVISLLEARSEEYSEQALECFGRIQSILRAKPQGKVLVQIVASDECFAGLSSLLKTASLENPQFAGQLILVPSGIASENVERLLEEEKRAGFDPLVKYENDLRYVLRWQEIAQSHEAAPVAFREGSVYLVTGGRGALGRIFAKEIVERGGRAVAVGREVDLCDPEAVRRLIESVRDEHGRLDGILHCAGMIADNYIIKKERDEFSRVLEPKVTGTINLDEATKDVDLDFFVLFSAVGSATGNAGQSDYTTANGFMDWFAANRNRRVAAGERHGRTRSINWPLWQDGGMVVDAANRDHLQQTTGMQPMHTATGIDAFHRALAWPHDQMIVVEGDVARLRTLLLEAPAPAPAPDQTVVEIEVGDLAEKAQHYLRKEFSELLKVPFQKIDPRAALENYGMDSMLAMKLTNQLEPAFGSLPKTLFFEYQTIRELADYLSAQYPVRLSALLSPAKRQQPADPKPVVAAKTKTTPSRRAKRRRKATAGALEKHNEPVAIIGLSGRYPEAIDIEAYWTNLRDGKDCITEIPEDRWAWREFFSEDRTASGRHYSKWGGFISGVDEFDPLFFNLSPVEAEGIDPQERLFLQHVCMAIEDAGYTRAMLRARRADDLPGQVGVYAGVMYTEYQLFSTRENGVASSASSVANRVSYFLNLHGPSIALDTMCSSSLTAIHLACQDLKLGRTSMAIAGGVNVSIHPNKYSILSAGQFISGDGHCQSFGEGGDGYIPGEGVGVVVLKRLSDAERDGDHIYGVIRGSALNHGGKTNGYTVPNPKAQSGAIRRALTDSGIDARHVSYVEAHGTGTKLGDPIEIAALTKAFGKDANDTGFCLIGSAKSNIGHCEAAAGIAGLTKVLLQMQHRQIVPSLHSEHLNPHIDFDSTPFIVNQALKPWERPVIDGREVPRIAGISSFGAGGSNAHMIVEEYEAPVQPPIAVSNAAIVLSARTSEQLQQKVHDLLGFIEPRADDLDLAAIAWTLQSGREAMDERLGFIVSSIDELIAKMRAWLKGEQGIEDLFEGSVKHGGDESLELFSTDADLQQTIDKWIAADRLTRLLQLWVKGLELDWGGLYGETKPRRISLPAYPFARERYWVEHSPAVEGSTTAVLHPLLHTNTSDLSEQRYRSTFTGDEFFLADHRFNEQKVLPGVAYLEMARAAIEDALPERPSSLELRNVVWVQPIIVTQAKQVDIALTANGDGTIDFEIFSDDVVHGQGSAVLVSASGIAAIEVDQLKAEMREMAPDSVYDALERMGLRYGSSLRSITAIHRRDGELLAELTLPGEIGDFVLHPSLMDGALQSAVALADELNEPRVPFALESLRILAPCAQSMIAWVRRVGDNVDIDLCDERGNVCVAMRGLATRGLSRSGEIGFLVAAPVWRNKAIEGHSVALDERHVILCDLPEVDIEQLASLMPLSIFLSLSASGFDEYATACFEHVQSILQSRPEGNVLVQVVASGELFASLSALLKTAAMENPRLIGQVVLFETGITVEELFESLEEESGARDALIRYQDTRQVLEWEEIAVQPVPIAFEKGGVYLVTGGRGALGRIFANEILDHGGRVVSTGREIDLSDLAAVRQLVENIQNEHGRLDGILHCAGMTADSFIIKKDAEEFRRVLEPKVAGTINLDEATKDVELDFFVLFSSIAGATGNPGQADYATANAFMDQFAAHRNRQVAAKQRHGRTRSINWPLWRDGGMSVDAAREEELKQSGIHAMRTATGIRALHCALALPHNQMLVVEGDLVRIRRALFDAPRVEELPQPIAIAESPNLEEKVLDYLRKELAEQLKLPFQKVDPQAALENYGIDSVLAMRLTNRLEKTFGSLSKTLFFEYQTIAALADYFIKAHAPVLQEILGLNKAKALDVAPPTAVVPETTRAKNRFLQPRADAPAHDVAIVGLSGRYPQADDLHEFWRNLQDGRDCITEIPADRWDYKLYFDADKNKSGTSYSKWGGFIADVDKFDPLFFNMSPKEAELIDPQERLFLQVAWETIEDAGYAKEDIAGGRVGVFVGAMWNHYELFGPELIGTSSGYPTSSHASIANRVSYFFDFHGPSIGLDTMCSSSLTAIHLAYEAVRRGEIDAAIAGGVNVTIHPYKHLTLSQGKFAATDGRCRSFGAGGDGYVPGEGVGAVLLKPLERALRDGDQIYAVIKSSSVNHGGKTNGYTVPNPNAQAELIAEVFRKGSIDPKTLSYIETHGTGTSLGDPIEITGLVRAFEGSTDEKQFCPIGSVKSNIGHLESAAGIAAVTKALLQLKYDQLVPSIHADPPNPHIDFANTPFYVQPELADWKPTGKLPRRVGVSSFGAGGSNAHLVLEEYLDIARTHPSTRPTAFVLSAKNEDALRRYAERIVRFLETTDVPLASIAYTSQVGRTPMDARLAVIASTIDELRGKLEDWLGSQTDAVFFGSLKDAPYTAADLIGGSTGKAFIEALLANHEIEKIAQLWILGAKVDWSILYSQGAPRKVSLPTYPFARERCWITQQAPSLRVVQPVDKPRCVYYQPQWVPQPLVSENVPTGSLRVLDDELSREMGVESAGATSDVVVHHAAYPCNLDDEQEVRRQLNGGVHALFDLLKKQPAPRRILSLVSGPLGVAISGFLKTLTLENPSLATKTIEVDSDLSVAEKAAIIRNELVDPASEVRYRNGVRSVRTLAPLEGQHSSLPLRHKGVYLVTGGLGGLGLIFAEYLAKQYRARLVLIGRTAKVERETLARFESYGAEVLVLAADVTKREDMERVVLGARARFSNIHGVIHAAGLNRDALLVHKTREQMDEVLAPKIYGTINVDRATSGEKLDFFALFSSAAAVTGNVGQCDYAYANRFLDAFAEDRANLRSGRTVSINWPLWEEGGMTIPREQVELLEQQTGLLPLPTHEGIQCWEGILGTDAVQAIPLYGNVSRIAAFAAMPRKETSDRGVDLLTDTEEYLKLVIGEEIKLDADRIGSSDPLESFGLDSVMINRVNAVLESKFGELPKTLLYEQETVRALATYLVREAREALTAMFGAAEVVVEPVAPPRIEIVAQEQQDEVDGIAIIGIHGRYPHSPDLDAYWENLREGNDLVDPVPPDRWDCEALYHSDPAAVKEGKIYCKWGGFLQDHDKFDPRFFKISTAEARLMDPQERLFLESVWAAIEDAGYTREHLRERHPKAGSADVGVFVGVTTNSYNLWGPEERMRGSFMTPVAMPWSIANRVSYFFDFNGPSLPIDTACSSSLVAIHLACESLRSGECQLAIAGGVNLYLHPAKYQSLCQKRMLSLDGKCHSYGGGDDGFVPGEGVGSLVLKPLKQAMTDGDHIYSVIRGSAFDHSGRSNGYSAPNPNAQARLISRTLEKAGVHPDTISYVEGHGTGTQMGDGLEVAALTQAFREKTARNQFCPIGCVKANVGHSESAAGIAGLAKVILQMQYGQLVPSIHADEPNPNIEFDQSPFYLQHELSQWPASADHPRRALVNSFGAGGVNACVVIEEYRQHAHPPAGAGPYLFILSARNEQRLRAYADRLRGCLEINPSIDLADLCYTHQVGREAMEERLAIIAADRAELIERLREWNGGSGVSVHRGSLGPRRGSKRSLKLVRAGVGEQSLNDLAARWVAGQDVEWDSLYSESRPRRVSAPTYPFARERYWVSDAPRAERSTPSVAHLHPLLANNVSTLKEVRFSSIVSDEAFYAVDHKVHDEPIFPGAAFLEMACISGNIASEQRVRKIKDVVWIQPLSFRSGAQSLRTVLRRTDGGAEYQIFSFDDDNEVVMHSEGKLEFGGSAHVEDHVAMESLKAQCTSIEKGTDFYERFSSLGLQYGPSFRTIEEIHIHQNFALAKLKIDGSLKGEFDEFILHPCVIDGALQTIASLADSETLSAPHVPFALDEIEILRPLPRSCWAYAEREDTQSHSFNIRLLNERGELLVRMKNLYVRPLTKIPTGEHSVIEVLPARKRLLSAVE